MTFPMGSDKTFEAKAMQNTHWYYSPVKGTHGWSANPLMAASGEVDRVGLHDCESLACPDVHAGNYKDYHKGKK